MSEIKPGSEVLIRAKVTATANAAGDLVVELHDRESYRVHVRQDLIAEVIAPPLPPQPPVGAYVEVQVAEASPDIWHRSRVVDEFGGVIRDGWLCLTYTGPGLTSWADLHKDAEVTRLWREDEQPQEKYERASTPNERTAWQHLCGDVAYWTEQPGRCDYCRMVGDWTPLYRKAQDTVYDEVQGEYREATDG